MTVINHSVVPYIIGLNYLFYATVHLCEILLNSMIICITKEGLEDSQMIYIIMCNFLFFFLSWEGGGVEYPCLYHDQLLGVKIVFAGYF